MIHNEYTWMSHDGLEYYGQSWRPGSQPLAVINLVHGIGEHSSRYEDWARLFVDRGYAILSFDYRGHGKSEGKRGHAPSYEDLMKDIDLLGERSAFYFPKIPVILYGHSMGGNFVLNYCLRREFPAALAVVTSPWLIITREPPKFVLRLARIVEKMHPKFTFTLPIHVKDISRSAPAGEQYKKDALVHKKITARLFFEVHDAAAWALENACKLKIPLLLMHGSSDKITSVEGSRLFASQSPEVTLKIWEGLYHELHNEEERGAVFTYIAEWLKERIK